MMKSMMECNIVAKELHTKLISNYNLKNVDFMPVGNETYCFRAKLVNGRGISIAVPPDAMGNRGDRFNEGVPSTYEIALYENGNVIYNESIGYEDICRFYTIEDIVKELQRLSNV